MSTDDKFYFFRFISNTRLSFSNWKVHQEREQKRIKNNYPADNAEIMVFDKRIKKDDFFHHYGLGFDVRIKNENKNEAKKIAETLVLNFIGKICFLEKSYIEPPQCILIYKYPLDGNNQLNEYQALLIDNSYYQPNENSLRLINCENFDFFLKKLLATEAETMEKIYFSLHWIWKATGTSDKRDRFINLWVALEILESSLKKHYGLPVSKTNKPQCKHCKTEFELCPKCEKDFSYNAPSGFTGFKKLEEEIENSKILKFNKIHSKRSALVHSGGNLSVEEIDTSIFSTRALINCAILTLLKFTNSIADGILMANSELRSVSLPKMLEFKGEIKVKEIPTVDDIEKQPSVEAKYSYDYEMVDEDLVCNIDVEHTFNANVQSAQVEKVVRIDSSQNTKDVWERTD